MTTTNERYLFERWRQSIFNFANESYELDRAGNYVEDDIDISWQGWKAGRVLLLARIAELEDELLGQREKNILLAACLKQAEDAKQ